jgi:hypothetical protein
VLPQSPIGKAITYARNQRQALERFLEDGRLRLGRVDARRGSGRLRGVAVAGGFRPAPVPQSAPWPRFRAPLIEPDVRISRIRLSSWTSQLRARLAA